MLQTCAEASRALDDKRKASQYLEMATRNAEFLTTSLRPECQLRRSWRNGKATYEVFLEDYGALMLGLLELYQTDFNNRWFTFTRELADEMTTRFSERRGAYYDTPDQTEAFLVRPKDIKDNATPCGDALASQALLKLAALTDDGKYLDHVERGLKLIADLAPRFPMAFAFWLSVADQALDNGRQIAVLFDAKGAEDDLLLEAIRSAYRPNVVVAASRYPPLENAPARLLNRPLREGKTTAYVCEHFACKQPVNLAHDLLQQL